jgi:hypothetical protein
MNHFFIRRREKPDTGHQRGAGGQAAGHRVRNFRPEVRKNPAVASKGTRPDIKTRLCQLTFFNLMTFRLCV